MATVPQTCRAIASLTQVPERTVGHLARRLGEAEMLPRGPRGVNAPHIEPVHAARILIGVMSLTDGINATAAKVVQAVERIGALDRGGEGGFEVYASGDPDDSDTKYEMVPYGSFIENVAQLLQLKEAREQVAAVGLRFDGEHVSGWSEYKIAEGQPNHIVDVRRVYFGGLRPVSSGMSQEVRVDGSVLDRLSALLEERAAEPSNEIQAAAAGGR